MKTLYYLKLLGCLFFAFACSTQKDAALNRFYHQLNTQYNGVFYAQQNLNGGIKKLSESHQDNYKEILSLNQYGDLKAAKSSQAQFDQAIEKSTMAIKKHSMDIDGEEKNKLIDQAYLIIGKSKFYKHDYLPAINTFNYLLRKSQSTQTQSAAALWIAKCNLQLKNEDATVKSINKIEEEYTLTKQQTSKLFEIQAELAILQGEYGTAQKILEKVIETTKNKITKTRGLYILGQLALLNKDYVKADIAFKEVIKKNPEYNMVFNAKLSQTQTYSPGKTNFNTLNTSLNKMLKDKKNLEYRDQIYFSLAQIQLKKSDTLSGIGSLEKSAQLATYNTEQKVESHHLLAKIFWEQGVYVKAYNHCDSAYALLDAESAIYNELKNMLRVSRKIAIHYNNITHNDSIINLAQLPEEERNEHIDNYIAELRKKEEQLKPEGAGGRPQGFNSYEYEQQSKNSMNITSGGGWYFYNPSAISLGYSEFMSRWGNRKLEDNWRRKNKSQYLDEDALVENQDQNVPNEKEKYSREYYLSNLPLKEEEQLILLSKIETSYYDLSHVFKDELQDYTKAMSLYNELFERFPNTDYRALIYFDQFNIYSLQKDTVSAESIRKKIEEEFPNTNYLEILEQGGAQSAKQVTDKNIYRQAYNLYSNFNQHSCDSLATLLQENADNMFVSQIELLNIFCQAKKSDKNKFVSNLEELSQKYPGTTIANKVDSIVLILRGEIEGIIESMYQNSFDSQHHFFLVLKDTKINLPETQKLIASFNSKNHKLDNLQITNMLLTKQEQILRVSTFENKEKAMVYYELIQESPTTKNLFTNQAVSAFVISDENFKKLLKEKSLNPYEDYFNSIYLLN